MAAGGFLSEPVSAKNSETVEKSFVCGRRRVFPSHFRQQPSNTIKQKHILLQTDVSELSGTVLGLGAAAELRADTRV